MIYSYRIEDTAHFDLSKFDDEPSTVRSKIANYCLAFPKESFYLVTDPNGLYVTLTPDHMVARASCRALNNAKKEIKI